MMFSASFLLAVLPLLASQVSAVPAPRGGQGANGGKGAAATAGAAAANATAANATAVAANSTAAANATAVAANSTAAAANVTDNAANATAANATAAAAAASSADTDLQTSLTLDPAIIAPGFAQNGQAVQEAGQVASLTSTNNFINFCATTNLPLTNGQQIKTGSCNPAPIGLIAGTAAMPSAKFVNPTNGQTLATNQPFTITMAINNLATGNFVNADTNYFSAPQQLNSANQILGHSHVVVEKLTSLTQTTPTDPNTFAFFKGLNAAAVNGQLTADVTAGLPAGTYRLASINTAANHQPALVAVAQHGSVDDMVYFTVADGGAAAANATAAASNATAAATASNSTAAASNATAANATAATAAATGAANATAVANSTAAAGAATGAAAAGAAKGAAAGATAAGAAKGAAAGGKGAAKGGKARRFAREFY